MCLAYLQQCLHVAVDSLEVRLCIHQEGGEKAARMFVKVVSRRECFVFEGRRSCPFPIISNMFFCERLNSLAMAFEGLEFMLCCASNNENIGRMLPTCSTVRLENRKSEHAFAFIPLV